MIIHASGRLKNAGCAPNAGSSVRWRTHKGRWCSVHVAALARLRVAGSLTVNLGTGRGTSVLELVRSFERASGRAIPYDIAPRRRGDIAWCYASPSLVESLLGWKANRSVDVMCEGSWRWQSKNPRGQAPNA